MAVGTEGSDPNSGSLASQAAKAETTQGTPDEANQNAGSSTQAKPWHEGLPKELASRVQKFQSPEELAKGYVNLETKVRGWPGDDASEEAKQEYYKRIARPDSPDGYQLEAEPLPDGIEYAEGSDARFKKACHEAGLSPAQAKMLYKVATQEIAEGYKEALAGQAKAREDATQELRKSWGKEFDANMALVGRVGARFATPSLLKRWDDSGIGNDPDHIAFLAQIGRSMSEGTLQGGSGPGGSNGSRPVTPQDIDNGEAWRLFPNSPQLRPKGR